MQPILAVSLLSALAAASPFASPGLTFSVEPKVVKSQHSIHDLKAMTFGKFDLEARSPRQLSTTGSVAATSAQKFDYLVPLQLGGQTYELLFDTGSSDLWLMSSQLPASQVPKKTVQYNPAAVGGTLMNNYTFSISYVGGQSIKGLVYADTCTLGSATVTSQAVEAATSINAVTKQLFRKTDGIMGAAFSKINTVKPIKQNTFFTNLASSLAAPIFTTYLAGQTSGSSIDFGFIDPSKYTGDISYVPLTGHGGFWRFKAGAYSFSGSTYGNIGHAIVDTGTTLMYLPNNVAQTYYAAVSGAFKSAEYGGWVFPCSAQLPRFTINIGNTQVTVSSKNMNFGEISNKYCLGGMQDLDGSVGSAILGDVFLRSTFVVWDQGPTPRLGFAKKARAKSA